MSGCKPAEHRWALAPDLPPCSQGRWARCAACGVLTTEEDERRYQAAKAARAAAPPAGPAGERRTTRRAFTRNGKTVVEVFTVPGGNRAEATT